MSQVDSETVLLPQDSKALGAFYTDSQVADFLVRWAIRSKSDSVLDPSFGGGVFLRSACKRLVELAGDAGTQVFGVEIGEAIHAEISEKLFEEFGVRKRNLLLADFFAVAPGVLPQVDVVVGNPPFIRYQRFSGGARRRALTRAASAGVKLSGLASSWAPFVVASVGAIRRDGRLAMVVPFELCHASYALPVLRHLAASFSSITLLTFRKKLFPDLSEDTLLLLGEGKGGRSSNFHIRDLKHAGALSELQTSGSRLLPGARSVSAPALASGEERLVEQFIPRRARELYRELRGTGLEANPQTARLGELADVGIGYVTGANDFFHLSTAVATMWGVPKRYLRPAVRSGKSLTGLSFTPGDWLESVKRGEESYLLHLDAEDLPASVRKYLENGERAGVANAYKCRTRVPWYRVPHVYQPDAFLTYMSGTLPKLVANDTDAVAPNTLHVVRLNRSTPISRDVLATLWQTSLTRLSVEIEGHALGGGMLKLEPTEAENVLIALPLARTQSLRGLSGELDVLLRRGDSVAAQDLADRIVLSAIGLSRAESATLREAAEILRERRYARGGA